LGARLPQKKFGGWIIRIFRNVYIFIFRQFILFWQFPIIPKNVRIFQPTKKWEFLPKLPVTYNLFFCNLDVCGFKLLLFVIPYNTIFRLNREAFYLIYTYIISQFQSLSIEIMKIIMFLFWYNYCKNMVHSVYLIDTRITL